MPWLTQSAILQQIIGVLNLPNLHQADAELQRIENQFEITETGRFSNFKFSVAIVVLTNHSLNVLNTKAALVSPLILYGYAMFHAKFFNAIWVTVERLLYELLY